jgi:hypothetical protein
MIRWRMCKIVKRLARIRDDMRLANFEPVRGFNAKWKRLRRPAKYCLPNLAPLRANGNFGANRPGVVSGGSLSESEDSDNSRCGARMKRVIRTNNV